MRYQMTFSYDGTSFFGYQRQPNEVVTVQGEIEKALLVLFKEEVTIHASGRTDAGVHARGQVAHFDLSLAIPADKIKYALNRFLSRSIRIYEISEVSEAFHARKSAIGKHYSYTFYLGDRAPAIGYATFSEFPKRADLVLFKESMKPLLGEHDFQGFCGRGSSVINHVRTIYLISFEKNDDYLTVHFLGTGFLRKMIRNIIGTALDIAMSEKKVSAMIDALEKKDRTKGGKTAEPTGLVLEEVFYDKSDLKERLEALSFKASSAYKIQ